MATSEQNMKELGAHFKHSRPFSNGIGRIAIKEIQAEVAKERLYCLKTYLTYNMDNGLETQVGFI